MKNENPLKEYIHGKFGIVYDNIIVVLVIFIFNVMAICGCCYMIYDYIIEGCCNIFIYLFFIIMMICVDIFGNWVLWLLVGEEL